jgi:hypothetical protein
MRIFNEIELFKIVGRNKINWFVVYMLSICKIIKFLLVSCIGECCHLKKNYRNCLFFFINLYRCLGENQLHIMRIGSVRVLLVAIMKTTSHLVLTKKRHLRHSYRLMMLPCQVRCCNVKARSLHNGFHSRASTLCNGKTTCSIIL